MATGQNLTIMGGITVSADRNFTKKVSTIQLWFVSIMSFIGCVGLACAWLSESHPFRLAVCLLFCGVLLPACIIVFTLVKNIDLKQRLVALVCCILMCICGVLFALFGSQVVDYLGIGVVSYYYEPGRQINLSLSIVSLVLCVSITLWQHWCACRKI